MAVVRSFTLLFSLLLFIPHISLAIPQKGEQSPPFKVTSISGQQITLANYQGRVLLLEFFATWCTSCRDSTSHLAALASRYGKQGLHVLGLGMDEDGEKVVREFIISNRLNYPVALSGAEMQSDYAIRSVPTLYVIGKKGLIVEKFMGYNDEVQKRLDQLLPKLLSE